MEKTAFKFIWSYARMFKWFFVIMLIAVIVGQTSRQFVSKLRILVVRDGFIQVNS